MKKVLFFDIDGTLFNSKKYIPIKAKEAVFEARKKGHEIFIATGRAPFMIQDVLKELEINSYICFNGQYIVYNNEVVFNKGIDLNQLKTVSDFANIHNHPMVYMNAEKMISSISYHPHIEESISSLKFSHPQYEKNFYLNQKIYQSLVFCTEEEELSYRETFPLLKFVRWHRVSVDILPKGASKAKAIEFLCEHFNIAVEDTIAFGDGLNDIEMLETVGFGVCMGNGHEEALKRANYITDHVDDDGLVKAMKYLNLI
ncbi:Cof-type HAD-IIB family hydrolase [Paenisporosarcina sp. TG20]|uniref:Cof-type HAD-IIB family hydrolase n=1 Tax=Paenisporosarcina sp. TG20 TaxID=1211706 RepID=UPI0002E546B8|nr:Cof-type HAD-IIB family hydrolase [Paenisporosarcina sp. TG20]